MVTEAVMGLAMDLAVVEMEAISVEEVEEVSKISLALPIQSKY